MLQRAEQAYYLQNIFKVPFDGHLFQSIYMKLHNLLFDKEELKYLPPNFS